MIRVETEMIDRISQGDIFKDVEIIEELEEKEGELIIKKIKFPYVVVLSQDCDLDQDSTLRKKITEIEGGKAKDVSSDKRLMSVIVIPLYNSEHVFAGTHLSYLDMKMQEINKNKTPGTDIKNNNNSRYHYLEFDDSVDIPNSIIDFKHYFTLSISSLEKKIESDRVCHVSELYREHLSHRFAYYLSRIGLPV